MSGTFKISSSFETTCCQELANDFSALQQFYLAIEDGQEHLQGMWDTVTMSWLCAFSRHLIGLKAKNSYLYLVDL